MTLLEPDPASGDVIAASGWTVEKKPRMGFFTDTSVCIGCKACEVACKEWNAIPDDGFNLLGSSYDNTGSLGASTWRHVAFIEQPGTRSTPADHDSSDAAGGPDAPAGRPDFRWLMESDVCKHCTHAACLDVCPTGSLFRTEFGTVVVQDDICNGCGYCVPACPFGVIERRSGGKAVNKQTVTKQAVKNEGLAQKCTLCYDRLGAGMTPACAQTCPTESIQFGEVDELRKRAAARLAQLHAAGVGEAQLYGDDPGDGIGGAGAMFLLLDEPETYGLPPDPVVTTRDLPDMWRKAVLAAGALAAAALASFVGRRP